MMNIEKLQSQIEELPENERQTIQKIRELNDSEIEEVVAGLSDKAKNILLLLGAFGATAVLAGEVGSILGHKSGYKSGRAEAIAQYTDALKIKSLI